MENILVSTDAEVSLMRALPQLPAQTSGILQLDHSTCHSPRVWVLSWGAPCLGFQDVLLTWWPRSLLLTTYLVLTGTGKMCLVLSTGFLRKKLQISFLRPLYCSQNFSPKLLCCLMGISCFMPFPTSTPQLGMQSWCNFLFLDASLLQKS